jgi:hypothetical protein
MLFAAEDEVRRQFSELLTRADGGWLGRLLAGC